MERDSIGAPFVESTRLPTKHCLFTVYVFPDPHSGDENLALVHGDVARNAVLTRVHSECMTGDVFGSRRCDCGDQLELAMQKIAEEGAGLLIYLRQEGRGIGLQNKLRAYRLQDRGLDTVEANLELGLPADGRVFDRAAEILERLGVRSVRLLTNNPRKASALDRLGVEITERVPIRAISHADNHDYLETKRTRLGHDLISTDDSDS